jgi:hypothetical protein
VRLQAGQRFISDYGLGFVLVSQANAGKIIENFARAQAVMDFPQRPQTLVPAG